MRFFILLWKRYKRAALDFQFAGAVLSLQFVYPFIHNLFTYNV